MVRLGKMHLRWCDQCNVPVLESPVRPLRESHQARRDDPSRGCPAGVRFDLNSYGRLSTGSSDEGSGRECSRTVFALMNKVPALDRMDEVIADGSGGRHPALRPGKRMDVPAPDARSNGHTGSQNRWSWPTTVPSDPSWEAQTCWPPGWSPEATVSP